MFRRKEDGTEELINDNEAPVTQSGTASPSASGPAHDSPRALPPQDAPRAPLSGSAPASQPAFRPVPPQAAMAAARPVAAAPQPAQAHSPEPQRQAATPVVRPSAKRVLTVGPDIQMKGEITSCDRVVIEGMVDATMRDVHTVELAETGALKGTAEVEDAEISGSFEGDLLVRGKLTIHSSGRVRGNVTYGDIEIQRGGQISGNIRNVADAKTDGRSQPNPAKKAA